MIFAFYQMFSCTPRLETGFNWITYRIPKVGSRIIFQPSTFQGVNSLLASFQGVVNHPKNWNSKHFTTETGIFISPTTKIKGCFENIVIAVGKSSLRFVLSVTLPFLRKQEKTSPIHLCNLCGHDVGPSACLISHQKWEIFMTPCHGYLYNTRSGWSGWSACFLAKFLFVSPPASNFLFLTSLAIRAQSLHSQLPWFPGARSWESKLLFFCCVKNWRGGFLGLDDSWNVNVSGF